MDQLYIGDILAGLARKSGYDERRLSTALGLASGTVRALSGQLVTPAQARYFCQAVGLDFEEFVADLSAREAVTHAQQPGEMRARESAT